MAQASQDDIRQALIEALELKADEHGVDIVDVEVVGSTKARTVRVRIDHANEQDGTITLDEVSEQTAWISDLLDEADPIDGHYTLEVSSPGLSRPLRKPRDFVRFAGQNVALTLKATEGRRRYSGRLEGFGDDGVTIVTDEGAFTFALDEVRSCKIQPDFGTPGKGGPQGRNHAGRR